MTADRLPADQSARDRIREDLDATLFVDAGAGTGKTSALVDRVLALVTTGTCPLENLAAITFTEKAGAELRERIRRALERALRDGALRDDALRDGALRDGALRDGALRDGAETGRLREALDQLDAAAIGTLHSFAQRILTELSVEADLPPNVEALDEIASTVEHSAAWSRFLDDVLDDPDLERTMLLLDAAGVRIEQLRKLAEEFNRNWDLVEARVPAYAPQPPDRRLDLLAALDRLDAACRMQPKTPQERERGNRSLRRRLDEIAPLVERLRHLPDEIDFVEALCGTFFAEPPSPSLRVSNLGNRKDWDDIAAVRRPVLGAGDAFTRYRTDLIDACVARFAARLRAFILDAAAERRSSGRLAFHDLLVNARNLLTRSPRSADVRRRLHNRYRCILLDEFQDTDPLQIELAVRIAAADSADPAGLAAPDPAGHPAEPPVAPESWGDIDTRPGHLFFVGDPKQSIYRFRRADIALYLRAQQRFGDPNAALVRLTANFRTVPGIVAWVNQVFGELIGEGATLADGTPSQPPYQALVADRKEDPSRGPCVATIGSAAHPQGTVPGKLRASEATAIAGTVVEALTQYWQVRESAGDEGSERWRDARPSDIAILLPARTTLDALEDALDSAGIPYRTESSSLVYATGAVRDLLLALRAVDDPTNHLRVVSALRTPLFGCGDDDLYRYARVHGGSWDYLSGRTGTAAADDPVVAGLDYLRRIHLTRHWSTPAELLDRIARDRRAYELGFSTRRARDVWRRIRFVTDQARAWSEATGGTLRDYVAWVDLQSEQGDRTSEVILPESDDEAVRVMTVHAAKGLEFPIVILGGMTVAPQGRRESVVFPAKGSVVYNLGGDHSLNHQAGVKSFDEEMVELERVRLLYVACTRAMDHLVVSVHRTERGPTTTAKPTWAETLHDAVPESTAELHGEGRPTLPPPGPPGPPGAPGAPGAPATHVPSREAWRSELDRVIAEAGRAATVSATSLHDPAAGVFDEDTAAGLAKGAPDPDLPPWMRGRYGTSVGSAVHGVLQTIDLSSGTGLDAAVAAQCEAESTTERAAEVAQLVTTALASPSVREAAASPHWRELYVCTPLGERLLEGYIDLLYRSPDGLVVVDYKTASTSDQVELDRRVEHYRNQGAAYALALEAVTAEPVARVTFVFLTPGGAIERALPDLPGTKELARRLAETPGASART